jgi:hypothetical protein
MEVSSNRVGHSQHQVTFLVDVILGFDNSFFVVKMQAVNILTDLVFYQLLMIFPEKLRKENVMTLTLELLSIVAKEITAVISYFEDVERLLLEIELNEYFVIDSEINLKLLIEGNIIKDFSGLGSISLDFEQITRIENADGGALMLYFLIFYLKTILIIYSSISHFPQLLYDNVRVFTVLHKMNVVSGCPDHHCSELIALEKALVVLECYFVVLFLKVGQ